MKKKAKVVKRAVKKAKAGRRPLPRARQVVPVRVESLATEGTPAPARKKIAIVGGGMAGLTAAWELTEGLLAKRHEVTVYTQGWRLGGKGASARNPKAKVVPGRIEEHGLHFIFGFYDNAFRIIRRCYDTLDRDWKTVFIPNDKPITMYEGDQPWTITWPKVTGEPGEGETSDAPIDLLRKLSDRLLEKARAVLRGREQVRPPSIQMLLETVPNEEDEQHLIDLAEKTSALLGQRHDKSAMGTSYVQAFGLLSRLNEGLALVKRLASEQWVQVWVLLRLMTAIARGVLQDIILGRRAWFDLDDEDLRAWLKRHGAADDVVRSPFVRGLYDAAFSEYVTLGAGSMLHALMRAALTAKGAPFYRMAQGMGDAIFAPLYEVLKQRGVRFEFFHRLRRVERKGDRIVALHFDQQTKLKGSSYDPLFEYPPGSKQRCWPHEPLWNQIDAPATLGAAFEDWWAVVPAGQVVVRALDGNAEGKGFHTAVLATSIGVLPFVCEDLADDPNNPAFAEMLRGVATTQTQAAQLYFKKGTQLGAKSPTIIPFTEPFDTIADMSHLAAAERWDQVAPGKIGSLQYLCSPLQDDGPIPHDGERPDYVAAQLLRARKNLKGWLDTSAYVAWPGAAKGTSIDLSFLAEPLDEAHVSVPANPSDRYVLSCAGTHRYRLDAHQSGYPNLVLAGDWTRNALSIGCLESAVMSGVRAAQAIDPQVPRAPGDWLPPPVVPPSTAASSLRATQPAESPPRPYILRDGDLLAVPPIGLDVRLSMFLLEADVGRLQRLCDHHLNLGEAHYRPLWPYVMFYTSTMDNVVPGLGTCREIDCGFWVPLLRGRHENGRFVAERLVTYTPYLWVDNDLALIGGREVFGFPKHLGRFDPEPTNHRSPTGLTIKANVLREFRTDARVDWAPVVTLEGKPTGSGTETEGWGGILRALLSLGREHAGDLETIIKNAVAEPGMGVVFLKQAPHSQIQRAATRRSIVEGTIALEGLPKLGLIESKTGYSLTIPRYATHDIVHRLGLRQRGGKVPVVKQAWMEFRAQVGAAHTEIGATP